MQTADKINLVIAIATCVSVLGSLFVALLTHKITKATQKTAELMEAQLEAACRPYILITPQVRIGTSFFSIQITNTGQSSATNLCLRIDQDFYFDGRENDNENLRSLPAFNAPIDSFPPKAELSFGLGIGPNIFKGNPRCPQKFSINATYSYGEKTYDESTQIDLTPYFNANIPHDEIVRSIHTVNETLKKLVVTIRR